MTLSLRRLYKGALGAYTHFFVEAALTYLSCSPGRIHHCMRSIGVAQMALDLLLARVTDPAKKTFGKYLHEHGEFQSLLQLQQARLIRIPRHRYCRHREISGRNREWAPSGVECRVDGEQQSIQGISSPRF